MHKLERLERLAGPFPTTAQNILDTAKQHGLGQETIAFMRQFPPDETFESSEDFVTRSYELNVLIKQEREAPEENLRSAEG